MGSSGIKLNAKRSFSMWGASQQKLKGNKEPWSELARSPEKEKTLPELGSGAMSSRLSCNWDCDNIPPVMRV